MQTNSVQIRRRLEGDGWYLARHGSGHDIYRHPVITGIITLPRHRTISRGVARSIAEKADWLELTYAREDPDLVRYPALIDGETGAYGVTFPDLPGIVAMGKTVDEALLNAEETLRDYVIETETDGETISPPSALERVDVPNGQALVSVPLIRISGRNVRAHMTLDEGVAAFIDSEARRRRMTRKAYVEWMVRRIAEMGG